MTHYRDWINIPSKHVDLVRAAITVMIGKTPDSWPSGYVWDGFHIRLITGFGEQAQVRVTERYMRVVDLISKMKVNGSLKP